MSKQFLKKCFKYRVFNTYSGDKQWVRGSELLIGSNCGVFRLSIGPGSGLSHKPEGAPAFAGPQYLWPLTQLALGTLLDCPASSWNGLEGKGRARKALRSHLHTVY